MATHAELSGHTLRALYLDLCTGRPLGMSQPYTGEPLSPLLPPIAIPKQPSLMPIYVAIMLGGMLIGGGLAITISLVRPPPTDNATLISTVLTGIGVAVLQALNFIKSNQAVVVATQTTEQVGILHKSVNSGFEEFARLIRAEARAAGKQEAEAKQLDLAAVEARISAAVAEAVAKTLAAMPHGPPATISPSVDVASMQPQPIEDIAAAVRPEVAKDIITAVTDALPPAPPPERGV